LTAKSTARANWLEVFLVALRLGLTSFGGPIAHLGYFRDEYVVRRRWLDEKTYADLVAARPAVQRMLRQNDMAA